MKRDINLYQDPHTGGWILEVFTQDAWHRVGVFGTRKSALEALSK